MLVYKENVHASRCMATCLWVVGFSCRNCCGIKTAVMCPGGLGLVLEVPQGQRAVALALALITKSLALVPKSLASVFALR